MNSIRNINSNLYGNNVQFRGLLPVKRVSLRQRQESARVISSILSQDKVEIFDLTKKATKSRMHFLRNLADRYNQTNYYKTIEDREDSTLVNKIYQSVKKPTEAHDDLLMRFQGSINGLSRIFTSVNNNVKRLLFAQKVNRDILMNHPNSYNDLLPELLESKNSQEYVNNYPKYRSYLKINRDNEEVINNLDEMVNSGTYSQEKYDTLYKNKKLQSRFYIPQTSKFDAKEYAQNYSEIGDKFLKYCVNHFNVDKNLLEQGADEVLLDMFKTSTKDNIKLRMDITNVVGNLRSANNKPELQVKQLQELNKLYKTIDNDSDAKKFVESFVDNEKVYGAISINDLNQVLSVVPTKKLAIFSDNARNIINSTSGKERLSALLNDIENPFFETKESRINRKIAEHYGFQKPQTRLHNLVKKIKNQINIIKYNKYRSSESEVDIDKLFPEKSVNEKSLQQRKNVANIQKDEVIISKPKQEAELSKTELKEELKEDKNAGIKLTKNEEIKELIRNVRQVLTRSHDYKELAESLIELKPTREKHNADQFLYNEIFGQEILTPQARARVSEIDKKLHAPMNYSKIIESSIPSKLTEEEYNQKLSELKKAFTHKNVAKQDVLMYVQKRLGLKTFDKQKKAYKDNATKMKLRMLPEIFASISETRKADKAVGKKRINSSNKDALSLYLLINGSNRKYVNYLLKKRNVDNTRMFEVKDIIEMLRKSETKVAEQKLLNRAYRACDAKEYYNHLYNSKVQQYGKVKKQKVINTEA